MKTHSGKFTGEVRNLKKLVTVHWPQYAQGVGTEVKSYVESEGLELKRKSGIQLAEKNHRSTSYMGCEGHICF